MSSPFKVCPVCQQPAALAAVYCQKCSHAYRTQFAPTDQTMSYGATQSAALRPEGQRRDRLAASLLAFFLGGFGAHWFYLGKRSKGAQYLTGWVLSWATWWIVVGWVGVLIISCMCLYDFVTLLSMDPATFDAQYNLTWRQ